jgi:hypothetical protein
MTALRHTIAGLPITFVCGYLVVDEAGQVSLANIVGVSLATQNLILLGDQMQLEQPIQGTHPGETGQSTLQYYLQGHATIPPELGIFLDRSYRMHPDVCSFISETVYEGRLRSIEDTARQRILINQGGVLLRKEAGVVFVGVEHEGNLQASDEEIELVMQVFQELLGRTYRSKDGLERPLLLEDFLFVSPYNLQVARLRARLPGGARVGSVDKFQGQEAPVTIFSLGSSFGEYGSRGLAFLLDRNRINVAISRAQCLAIVIGDPRIGLSEASSLEEVALVNLFCLFFWCNDHILRQKATFAAKGRICRTVPFKRVTFGRKGRLGGGVPDCAAGLCLSTTLVLIRPYCRSASTAKAIHEETSRERLLMGYCLVTAIFPSCLPRSSTSW